MPRWYRMLLMPKAVMEKENEWFNQDGNSELVRESINSIRMNP